MFNLPDELNLHIFSFLSGNQLLKLSSVSTDAARLVEDNNLWKSKIKDTFYLDVQEKASKSYYLALHKQLKKEKELFIAYVKAMCVLGFKHSVNPIFPLINSYYDFNSDSDSFRAVLEDLDESFLFSQAEFLKKITKLASEIKNPVIKRKHEYSAQRIYDAYLTQSIVCKFDSFDTKEKEYLLLFLRILCKCNAYLTLHLFLNNNAQLKPKLEMSKLVLCSAHQLNFESVKVLLEAGAPADEYVYWERVPYLWLLSPLFAAISVFSKIQEDPRVCDMLKKNNAAKNIIQLLLENGASVDKSYISSHDHTVDLQALLAGGLGGNTILQWCKNSIENRLIYKSKPNTVDPTLEVFQLVCDFERARQKRLFT